MRFKKIFITLYALILLGLLGCSSSQADENILSEKTGQMLGTVITGQAYGENSRQALDLAFKKVQDIDDKMSRHKKDSTLSLINKNAGKKPVEIDPDTYKVIEGSLFYAKKSGGAFNPLLGNLIEAWAIGTDDANIPEGKKIERLLTNINLENLTLGENPPRAFIKEDDLALDLGAIAKGYAADEMVKILKEEGIDSALLNLGGNIIVIGGKDNKIPWKIGIQNPLAHDRGDLAGILEIYDTSAVTSGSYERFFEEDGVRYHHILDPQTGYPSDSDLISSTIISPNSMKADALSTAVYIMGKKEGMKLIESLDNTEAILISKDNTIAFSSGINKKDFKIKSKDFSYEKN